MLKSAESIERNEKSRSKLVILVSIACCNLYVKQVIRS